MVNKYYGLVSLISTNLGGFAANLPDHAGRIALTCQRPVWRWRIAGSLAARTLPRAPIAERYLAYKRKRAGDYASPDGYTAPCHAQPGHAAPGLAPPRLR